VKEHDCTATIQLLRDRLERRVRKIDAVIVAVKDYSIYLQLIKRTIDLLQCGVDVRKWQRCEVPKAVGALLAAGLRSLSVAPATLATTKAAIGQVDLGRRADSAARQAR